MLIYNSWLRVRIYGIKKKKHSHFGFKYPNPAKLIAIEARSSQFRNCTNESWNLDWVNFRVNFESNPKQVWPMADVATLTQRSRQQCGHGIRMGMHWGPPNYGFGIWHVVTSVLSHASYRKRRGQVDLKTAIETNFISTISKLKLGIEFLSPHLWKRNWNWEFQTQFHFEIVNFVGNCNCSEPGRQHLTKIVKYPINMCNCLFI